MDLYALKQTFALSGTDYASAPPHVAALCAALIPTDRPRLSGLVADDLTDGAGGTNYKLVARMGYALAVGGTDETLTQRFTAEASRLSGRTFFTEGRAPQFEIDGIALLGVAMGLKVSRTTDTTWLRDLMLQSFSTLKDDERQAALVRAAQNVLDDGDFSNIINARLRTALSFIFGTVPPQSIQQEAWTGLLELATPTDHLDKALNAAVFHQCAASLGAMSINSTSRNELIGLLENVATSMSHWTYEDKPRVRNAPQRQWEIDHEYHVQNLLWTILKPIFPDLIDEESLPKVGHTSPRYDLGIPSLHTIIEVKYLKKTGQAALRKLTEEIAADSALYLAKDTGYTSNIAFVWDDCRQTEEYVTLKSGLESLDGIEKVVVLPRPARMKRLS